MEENQQDSNSTGDPQTPILQPTIDNNEQVVVSVDANHITWSAVEFIGHKKSFKWYLIFCLVLATIVIGLYFIVHSIFPPVMVLLIGFAFAIIASRPPRTLKYELSDSGIQIGNRFSSYGEFKSFSVVDEETLGSITFNPFKRFAFTTAIYYELIDEDKILNLVSKYLPHVDPPSDPVDQLMRRLHF